MEILGTHQTCYLRPAETLTSDPLRPSYMVSFYTIICWSRDTAVVYSLFIQRPSNTYDLLSIKWFKIIQIVNISAWPWVPWHPLQSLRCCEGTAGESANKSPTKQTNKHKQQTQTNKHTKNTQTEKWMNNQTMKEKEDTNKPLHKVSTLLWR